MRLDVPLPPLRPEPVRKPLRLAAGELWCRHCGADTPAGQPGHGDYDLERTCMHCGSTDLVPAVQFLRPDEYYVCQ